MTTPTEIPEGWSEFIADLQKMEQRAAKLGLWRTMHSINSAVRQAGWEAAGDLEAGERYEKKRAG